MPLTFDNEEARLQHSVAGLIQIELWQDPELFDNSLSEEACEIVALTFQESVDDKVKLSSALQLKLNELNNKSLQEKKCLWIALLSVHPFAHPALFRDLNSALGLSAIEGAILATATNDFTVRDLILAQLGTKEKEEIMSLHIRTLVSPTTSWLWIKFLIEMQSLNQQSKIHLFQAAIKNNQLNLLKYLDSSDVFFRKAFEKIQERNHLALLYPKNIDALEYIMQRAVTLYDKKTCEKMIQNVFDYAIRSSHIKAFFSVTNLAKANSLAIAIDELQISRAIRFGELEIFNRLMEMGVRPSQEVFNTMFSNRTLKHAFINHLIDIGARPSQEAFDKMFSNVIINCFHQSDTLSRLDVIERLISLGIRPSQEAVNTIFSATADQGNLAIFERLINLIEPGYCTTALAANNYETLRKAVSNNHTSIITRLLDFPSVLEFAISQRAHQEWLISYIDDAVAPLQYANPIPTLSAEQSRRYFSFLQNIIARRSPNTRDIELLLRIPTVRNLAEQPEQASRFRAYLPSSPLRSPTRATTSHQPPTQDLRSMARDDESSMRSLTQDEIDSLKALSAHYQSEIKQAGSHTELIKQLQNFLKERYVSNPACINNAGKTIRLPLTWSEFQSLNLTGESYKHALSAYYAHPTHTAFRFLSIPNPWLHPDANFVSTNRQGRYANFEAHSALIALFFCAAKDLNNPSIDGHTSETRLDFFVFSLSDMGRAHNQDRGEDDGMADKPSCSGGMKKRILGSVLGHPLLTKFTLLTQELINQHLRDFVRAQFHSVINESNRAALHQIYKEYIEEGSLEKFGIFHSLNIPTHKQDQFIRDLETQYGTKVDPFKSIIIKKFSLITPDDCHALSLGGLADLPGILGIKSSDFETITQSVPDASARHLPSEFTEKEAVLFDKIAELMGKSARHGRYNQVARSAFELRRNLRTIKSTFERGESTLANFKLAYNEAINQAKPIFSQHRGTGLLLQALLDVFNALILITTLGFSYMKTNKIRLFSVPTDSEKKLGQLQATLPGLLS